MKHEPKNFINFFEENGNSPKYFSSHFTYTSSSSRNVNGRASINFLNSFESNGHNFSVHVEGKTKANKFIYSARVMLNDMVVLKFKFFVDQIQIIIYFIKLENLHLFENNSKSLLNVLSNIVKVSLGKIMSYVKNNSFKYVNSNTVSVFVLSNNHKYKDILDYILENLNFHKVEGKLDLFEANLDKLLKRCKYSLISPIYINY